MPATPRRSFTPSRNGKLRTSVIRECLVALTGNSRLARILDQFLYWSERVKDVDGFIEEERSRCERSNEPFTAPLAHGWIYKAASELIDEIMLDESEQTIRRDISSLVEWGYLQERKNPKHAWDRTTQYRVDLLRIQEDLLDIGYCLPDYPLLSKVQLLPQGNLHHGDSNIHGGASRLQNGASNGRNGAAIPETTSETTSETKKNGGLPPALKSTNGTTAAGKGEVKQDSLPGIKPPTKTMKEKEVDPVQDAYFKEVCRLLGWDSGILTKRNEGIINNLVKSIRRKEGVYTLPFLASFFVHWWSDDWRRKNNKWPHPGDLSAELGKYASTLSLAVEEENFRPNYLE